MMDYSWKSPAQRIEMSNQFGWRARQPQTNPGGFPSIAPGWNPVHPPPTIPGGTPGFVPSGSGFNPWQQSGIGSGNNPVNYTVPTDSHNVVQIPGLPPVTNPATDLGGDQTINPSGITGYSHGGVIHPGLEQYRKLLQGNWRPRTTTITDPDALTGVDTGKIAKKT